jgi:hypothetical protein
VRWFDPIISRQRGRRVYPSKIVRGSKRTALRALNTALQLVAKGVSTAPNKTTLRALIDAWLRGRQAGEAVRLRTLVDYRAF